MKPTQILMSEHRVIETVVDCLERIAQVARDEKCIPRAHATQALEVITTFADRCHHGKEEHALFPMLERRGLPRAVGPLAVMLNEHEVGRAAVRRMRDALATEPQNDAGAAVRFATAAGEYVSLLREHIAKEDGVLFPMADSMLTEADCERLLADFARTESLDIGAGTHERMLAIVERLCGELGIVAATHATASVGGGCCHGSCHA